MTWSWHGRSARCAMPGTSSPRAALPRSDGCASVPADAAGAQDLRRGAPRPRRVRDRRDAGSQNRLLPGRGELDLTRQSEVERFFAAEKPEYVFLAAAKVGGILANDTWPADFIRDNTLIEMLVLDAAHRHGVERVLFLRSEERRVGKECTSRE